MEERQKKTRPSPAVRGWHKQRTYDDYRRPHLDGWYDRSQWPRRSRPFPHPYDRHLKNYAQPNHRHDNIDPDEARASEEKRRTTSLVMSKLQKLTAEDKNKSMKQLLVEPVDESSAKLPVPCSREKEKEAKRIAHVKKPPRPIPAPKQSKCVTLPQFRYQDASHQEQIKRKVFQDLLKMPIDDLKNMATQPRSGDTLILSQLLRKTKKELSEAMRNLAESKLQNTLQSGSPQVLSELENLVDADIAVDVSNMPIETIQAFQRFFDLDLESDSNSKLSEENYDPYGLENSTDEDEPQDGDESSRAQAVHQSNQSTPLAVAAAIYSDRNASESCDLSKTQHLTPVSRDEITAQSSQISALSKPVQSPTIGSVMTSINVSRVHDLPQTVESLKNTKSTAKNMSHDVDTSRTSLLVSVSASVSAAALSTTTSNNAAKVTSGGPLQLSKSLQPLMSVAVENPNFNLYRLDNLPVQAFGMAKIAETEQRQGESSLKSPQLGLSKPKIINCKSKQGGESSESQESWGIQPPKIAKIVNATQSLDSGSLQLQQLGVIQPSKITNNMGKIVLSAEADRRRSGKSPQPQELVGIKPKNVPCRQTQFSEHTNSDQYSCRELTQSQQLIKPTKASGSSGGNGLQDMLPSLKSCAESCTQTEVPSQERINRLQAPCGSAHVSLPLIPADERIHVKPEIHSDTTCISDSTVGVRSFMTQTPRLGHGRTSKRTQTKQWQPKTVDVGSQTCNAGIEDGVMDCTVASSCDPLSENAEMTEYRSEINDAEVENCHFSEELGAPTNNTSIVNEFQNFISDIRSLPQHSESRRKVANHMIRVMTSSFSSFASLFMNMDVTNSIPEQRKNKKKSQDLAHKAPTNSYNSK